ncbi:hypothetical protein PTTG_25874 [Puccinia triticina 1-1 BBBD Race 1]|uniref:Uncharacterized protein n=1 Tax=Puccinia triticina (isolate 1-1 / race 1 (BBBD)) TaxID=630390 RepID=A0A180H095_PUCT1|nr:hypothetical protein PTTG_25874 [Puccinia triticina 1-1 BBBD Race 1]
MAPNPHSPPIGPNHNPPPPSHPARKKEKKPYRPPQKTQLCPALESPPLLVSIQHTSDRWIRIIVWKLLVDVRNASQKRTSTSNQSPNEFFTLTCRVEPLPFPNTPDRPQESYLEPSLWPNDDSEECMLFYEGTQDNNTSNLTQKNATKGPAPSVPPPDANIPNGDTARPTATDPPPPLAGPQQAATIQAPGSRPVEIIHHMFMSTAAGQLAQVKPRNPAAAVSKEWEQLISEGVAVLLTNIQSTTWERFKGLLQWQGIIMKHLVYSAKSAAMIANNTEFAPFVHAVVDNPLSKFQEHAQQDTLAMSYGSEGTWIALERCQTCLALNVSATLCQAPSPAASDIEVVSGPTSAPNSGIHCSPARKIAWSPAGEGIAHTISCLNFGRPCSPPSVLPTRKTPASSRE